MLLRGGGGKMHGARIQDGSAAAAKSLAKQSASRASSAGLVADKLSFAYTLPDGGKLQALSNISFALAPGEILAVLAPAFCGKTTLLKILAGRLAPSSGRATLGNAEITESLARRGLIFHTETQGAQENTVLLRILSPSATSSAAEEPQLILMDEPRSALQGADQDKARRLIVQRCRDSGKNLALTTHDSEQALLLGDQLLLLSPCRPAQIHRLSFAQQMLDPSLRDIQKRPDFTHLRDKFLNLYADIQKETPSAYKALQRPSQASEWPIA